MEIDAIEGQYGARINTTVRARSAHSLSSSHAYPRGVGRKRKTREPRGSGEQRGMDSLLRERHARGVFVSREEMNVYGRR